MTFTEDRQMEPELRDWDWQASLKAQGLSMAWISRRTGKSQRTVYAYAYKERTAPEAWLREVRDLLDRMAYDGR